MVTLNSLPIHDVLDEIRDTLKNHNRLILQAPPGAGKTTAVPLSLLNEAWLENKQIIMLEPRRLAARTAAARMAELLGESVGERVGYHIRSEKKLSEQTKILVVTEGILTRKLQNNPALENIALIIFDEFHERHLHSDLSLAFTLQSQECLRDDLKIIVMSATLDVRGLGELLNHPPAITSEGKSYPVTLHHLPPNTVPIDPKNLIPRLFDLMRNVLENESGDILVFLPGVREIKSLEGRLIDYIREHTSDLLVVTLYGDLSKEEQNRAITPSQRRKAILSTNIAETSITIDGVRVVIDSGLERIARFDPSSGMERLITQKISRASATQRAGRAGRLDKGSCYRLWSENGHHSLPPHSEPEILRCDLTPMALELSAWGSSANELSWIDTPPSHALEHAYTLLEELEALISPIRITPHGKKLLTQGVHPRLAHMLVCAQRLGFSSEAILLCILVSERDPFASSYERSADIRERFWLLCDTLKNVPTPAHLRDGVQRLIISARELAKRQGQSLTLNPDFPDSMISILLAMAYPDRIARIRPSATGRYLTAGGKEAVLNAEDDLTGSQWLIIARSNGDTKNARIHLCAPIDPEELERHFPELFKNEESVSWNGETQRVEGRTIKRLGAIILESRAIECRNKDQIAKKLCEGIRLSGLESLPWSDRARSLVYRLQIFYRYGEIEADFRNEILTSTLETWLMPHFTTHSSLRDLQNLDLYTVLSSQIEWQMLKRLDALLPDSFTAPTGNKIFIDYSNLDSPVLAVRIQEMFGVSVHPSVMEGKIMLLIHLLSPAKRPIQMTRDLVGFWSGSYSDVKKELKGRYPKHYWPDDPHSAQATTRTKKFMKES
ncbi:MAG: ATP-dependent helicase HrpB [Sulfuricurvum sp.]|nr:ATP-dependent helicase HrpB [Sulfuricurvum sp.]